MIQFILIEELINSVFHNIKHNFRKQQRLYELTLLAEAAENIVVNSTNILQSMEIRSTTCVAIENWRAYYFSAKY